MTSHPEAQDGQGPFWDPFNNSRVEPSEDADDRLTGVKSTDPFADDRAKSADERAKSGVDATKSSVPAAGDETDTDDQWESAAESFTSRRQGSEAPSGSEYFDQASSGAEEEEDDPTTPTASTYGGAEVVPRSEAIDHAALAPAPSSSREASGSDADDTLQPLNSNVNGDRAERGTDVYANAQPPEQDSDSEDDSPDASPQKSDSDSGLQDKGRVTFAGSDEVEQIPTQEDDSNGVLDKVKSTLESVKNKIHLQDYSAKGPLKKMNPTNVRMRLRFDDDPERDVGIVWRSRDNRKGRNSVAVPRTSMAYPNLPVKNRPVYSASFKGVGRNLWRMAFTFPYWDMAFWSGWSYTWGSVLFVIDGCWAWIPVGWPKTYIPDGIPNYASGLLFFIGALLYQLGATIAWLESVNDGSFHGSAMKRFLEGHEEDKKKLLDDKVKTFFGHLNPVHSKHQHEADEEELEKAKSVDPEAGWKSVHRRERPGSIYPGMQKPGPRRGGVDLGEAEEGETHEYVQWRWWPTWHAFINHHIYEIGFVACSIQLFGATLYSWCGLVSLHGITESYTTDADWYGGYWLPELFGSCCFLSASVFFLLETQEHWYKPMPLVVGWWIGFWAFWGSMGFL